MESRHPTGRGSSLKAQVVVTLIGYAFPPIAAFVTAPLLAQALGVEGRGELASVTAPLLLAVSLATVGIPPAVTFFVARNPRLLAMAVGRGALLVSGAGLVAVVVTYLASGWLTSGDVALGVMVLVASAAIIPTVIVSTLQAGAAGLGRWRLVAAERFATSALRVGAILGLFLSGELTVFTGVVVIAFSPVLGGIVYLFLRPARRDTASLAGARLSFGDLLGYGLRVWIGSVAGVLLVRIDQVIFLPIGGARELGLYVVAVAVSELPLILNGAVRDVMFTRDATAVDDRALSQASRMSTLITAFAAIAIAATGWVWIPILFGADFADAVPVALILLAAVVAGNPGSIAGIGLAARGRPGLRSTSLVIACGVNLILFLVLVPRFGAVGAAIATFAGNIIASNLNILLLKRHFGVPAGDFYRLTGADMKQLIAAVRRGKSPREGSEG